MSIYQNREYMSDGDGNVHIFVERREYLYTIVVMIDEVDTSLNGVVTFVATNEHGFDEASVNITVFPFQTVGEQPPPEAQVLKFVACPPKEVSIPVGSGAQPSDTGDISFTISGDPVPEIRLELNGAPIAYKDVRVVYLFAQPLTTDACTLYSSLSVK